MVINFNQKQLDKQREIDKLWIQYDILWDKCEEIEQQIEELEEK